MVLALRGEALVELLRGRPLVRLEPGAFAQPDQGVGLFRAGGDDAARAVILEAAPDQNLTVGQQRRGQRVAVVARHPLAVEGEFPPRGAVQQPPALGQPRAHAHAFPDIARITRIPATSSPAASR